MSKTKKIHYCCNIRLIYVLQKKKKVLRMAHFCVHNLRSLSLKKDRRIMKLRLCTNLKNIHLFICNHFKNIHTRWIESAPVFIVIVIWWHVMFCCCCFFTDFLLTMTFFLPNVCGATIQCNKWIPGVLARLYTKLYT